MFNSLPFLNFGAPLALLALIGLPALWWILRATPPKPRIETLPSFRLLAGLSDQENLPHKTPWWLMLLRVLIVACLVLAMALPSQKSQNTQIGNINRVLYVIDDGWTSAPYWQDIKRAMLAKIEALPQEAYVHFLLTTPKSLQTQPSEAFPPRQARALVQTLEPVAWVPDRIEALTRLQSANRTFDKVYWFSDGLDNWHTSVELDASKLTAFSAALSSQIQGTAPDVFVPKPASILRISAARFESGKYTVTTQLNPLAVGMPLLPTSLTAMTQAGFSLATADINFDAAKGEGRVVFDLPFTTAQRVARFKINGTQSTGNVWLTNLNEGPKFVGLVQDVEAPQPLLTDAHYIENAMSENVTLRKGSVTKLLETPPSVIIMADGVRTTQSEQKVTLEWIQAGGVLVRFATKDLGENLAGDGLFAVPMRRTARSLGSALNWDTPQSLQSFGVKSPFYGLDMDTDIRVTQQVLARAAPDLSQYTWAKLQDGSPLITTRKLGEGRLIFFHIGATPEWSNLVLSPLFPALWKRINGLAKSGIAPDTGEGQYYPDQVLDGFGRFTNPSDTSAPLDFFALETTPISEVHPAGYYRGPSGKFVRNVGAGTVFAPIEAWPKGARFMSDFGQSRVSLTEVFFAIAIGLLLIEALVFALYLMRPANGGKRKGQNIPLSKKLIIGLCVIGGSSLVLPSLSFAQSTTTKQATDAAAELNLAAAMGIKFGYIPSGESRLDTQSERGLTGLSRILFLRTSVEPETPRKLDLETDSLELYPMIYWPMPDVPKSLAPTAAAKLNAYMRTGGALIIDTRTGDVTSIGLPTEKLAILLAGLDVPTLALVPPAHVLNRTFYLISDYPGRFENNEIWVEAAKASPQASGVSRIIIGDADWAAAWATDSRGRSMSSTDGGQRGREFAYRFGVNLVLYILTGTYKADQVHLPDLIERLGEEANITLPFSEALGSGEDVTDNTEQREAP